MFSTIDKQFNRVKEYVSIRKRFLSWYHSRKKTEYYPDKLMALYQGHFVPQLIIKQTKKKLFFATHHNKKERKKLLTKTHCKSAARSESPRRRKLIQISLGLNFVFLFFF